VELRGESIIGFKRIEASGAEDIFGINPATGEKLGPPYRAATAAQVDQAAKLAARAFQRYGTLTGRQKAAFLREIATRIQSLGSELTERAVAETGLPAPRIQSETGRTCHQLRLFADMVEEGSWIDARIDQADPARQPLPKPDVRSLLKPLGPVVVFCASNFPLAFSVAGGDTASAFAAGCPVIVKAHHAHPGTAEMVGQVVLDAALACDLPEGVFSLLYGAGSDVGVALIRHPLVKAGGFTGSRSGGRALFDAASSRPEPIPFYAEMSSVNPVFILPRAMAERGEQIAAGLHASVTLGAGQFCTKPGLVFTAADAISKSFAKRLEELMAVSTPFTMLTPGIFSSYQKGVSSRRGHESVETLALPELVKGPGGCHATAALFQTDAQSYVADPDLSAEVFGPSTLLISYDGREQMLELARGLEGHLTATIHGTEDDFREHEQLLAILEQKVGRIVFNGFPTGVEVCHAMVHGGPYPATSDGRSTSVGTRAIYRFTRQVCYQGFPDFGLPDELKNGNPLGIWRLMDGQLTRDPI
jgi:alpha-ketoglutaric semialdehyde dehydrogenase